MYPKLLLPSMIVVSLLHITGCRNSVREAINSIDEAVKSISGMQHDFGALVDVIEDVQGNLDGEKYKRQIDDTIRSATGTAQVGVEGAFDFARARVTEDLLNLKQSLLGGEPIQPVPVLANLNTEAIDARNASQQAVTIVGWNLHIAERNPDRYPVTVENTKTESREIPVDFISYKGQYAVTLDLSDSGIVFLPHDSKVCFRGFQHNFEIPEVDPICWTANKVD